MTPAQAETICRRAERVRHDVSMMLNFGDRLGALVDASDAYCDLLIGGALDDLIAAIEAPGGRTEESRVWRVRRDISLGPDLWRGSFLRSWMADLERLTATQADEAS